jgi:hypothetical protein
MSWRNWSIEPIGVWFPKNIKEDQLFGMLEHVRSFRSDIPKEFGYEHVMLASKCWQMERDIKRGAYKRALESLKQILTNQMVGNNPGETPLSAANRN